VTFDSLVKELELNMPSGEDWLTRISKLNVYKAKGGPAPHKPLLFLVLLEMAEQGLLPEKTFHLTPDLSFRFDSYWAIVAHRRTQRPDVRFPFHHLESDGFWSALTEAGAPSPDFRLTRYAELDGRFLDCMKEATWRERARRLLIAKYFEPAERIALYTLVGLPIPNEDEISRDANFTSLTAAREKGREARFRLTVVSAHNYTCALTGYRLTTIAAGSIVDAAHIHQFSDSRNNDARNGIALCKNAHWLFDHGLWTLTDEYQVIVAIGEFLELSPDRKGLVEYHGQKIRLPNDAAIWPNPVHIAWHRRHCFRGK
jgi:putative restriction endonuclease